MTNVVDILTPINEMTVAELRIFLAIPRNAEYAQPFNTKTTKTALIENAKQAHFKAGQAEAEAQTLYDPHPYDNGGELESMSSPSRREIMDERARLSRGLGRGGRALGAKHYQSRTNPDGPLISSRNVLNEAREAIMHFTVMVEIHKVENAKVGNGPSCRCMNKSTCSHAEAFPQTKREDSEILRLVVRADSEHAAIVKARMLLEIEDRDAEEKS